jgi:predicted phage terminase large subunit-like protein
MVDTTDTADTADTTDVFEPDADELLKQAQSYEHELQPEEMDFRLQLEGVLDPRSKEFQDAIKLTPATLANHRTKGRWVPAEHLLFASSIIASEIAMGDARIIIEMPPRHGKSELASVHTPIWFLERWPWAHIILTTYAADFAVGFGRRVRDSFLVDTENLVVRVQHGAERVDNFLTTQGGGMTSVGIGGPITGKGADLLIVDDYIKNWMEASSDTTLEAIWNWFMTTAFTRLEPGASVIILATRWVVNDLIGRLKKEDKGNQWKVIRFPALAEANDPLNRAIGEALWQQRYSANRLLSIKQTVGNFIFSAMYQQLPLTVEESQADVEMLRIVDEIPNMQLYKWVRSWDLAATEERRKKGDYSVGSLIGTDGKPGSSIANTAIADMVRGRWKPGDLEIKLQEVAEADGPGIPILIEQEPGSSGKIAANHLATNVLRGYRVKICPPGGSNKWIRAQPYIAAVSHGRILMKKAAWNQTHKSELKDFPNSKNDDTVDSISQGFNELHQRKSGSATWGRTQSGLIVPLQAVSTPQGKKLLKGAVWGRS